MAALVNALTGCGMHGPGWGPAAASVAACAWKTHTYHYCCSAPACILQISQVLDVYEDLLRTPYRPQAVAAGGGTAEFG